MNDDLELTHDLGPAEHAMRAAGLSPLVSGDRGDFEASVKIGSERFYGYSHHREGAVRDLLEDIPETYRARIQA